MGATAGVTRPRVPTKLKMLKGTNNVTRQNKREPVKAFKLPEPPAELDERQRKSWKQFADVLDSTKITTEDDFAAFEQMVVLWAQWKQLQDDLRALYHDHGSYSYETVTQTGGVMWRTYPQLRDAGDVERRLLPLLGRFGMTPADRGRVSVIGGLGGNGNQAPEDEFT